VARQEGVWVAREKKGQKRKRGKMKGEANRKTAKDGVTWLRGGGNRRKVGVGV
jgi:hypothetical protein